MRTGCRLLLACSEKSKCAGAQTELDRGGMLTLASPWIGERMNTIIAGRFNEQLVAERAAAALVIAGFHRDQVATFFVNAAGQHDVHGTHEDPNASAGAHHAGAGDAAGVTTGTTVGAVAGMAAIPVLGPVAPIAGAAIGAYVGSLAGAREDMGDPERRAATPRQSGMFVAVGAPSATDQTSAIATLRAEGALDMERALGGIANGQWHDFDPLSTPVLA
jgi:hypothetical protein